MCIQSLTGHPLAGTVLGAARYTEVKEIFIIGDWKAKVGSQETTGVTGKFGLRVQNEAGQRLKEFCQGECTGHSKHLLPTTQEKTLHMDITR